MIPGGVPAVFGLAFFEAGISSMVKAQRDSLRLLRVALGAAILLPLTLFFYACWLDYRNVHDVTDKEIDRTTDVINEHALKVFESVQRAIAEVAEIIRDMPDATIAAQQAELHGRLRRIAEGSAQIKSLWIFDHSGHSLVNSLSYPADMTDFSDRDYFAAHVHSDVGTYVGSVLRPRPPYGGAPFFGVSRRRPAPDGGFNGVIQASILPEYFEGFYEKLARDPGNYASIVREDGTLLARWPILGRDAKLAEQGPLYRSMMEQPLSGKVTLLSAIDGQSRTVSYRKLNDFPVFVLAGMSTAAVRDQWLSQIGRKLIFGVPATAALIFIITLALRRTRRLYVEAAGRQAAEEALKQAQRLEALGQLTGGVAHDFNNLLMVIDGSVERLKSRPGETQVARSLSMIEAAVQKGASLTKQLLSFSRRQSISPRVLDAGGCVREFSDVLHQSIRSDIVIQFDLPEVALPVRVDRNEFEIAILNLTLNARDAMPEGGTIRIAVARRNGEDNRSSGGAGFVAITVSDTGHGIPEEIRDHVFEPYFTTKKLDKGTGLGLSQVYGFARQSEGAVSFETSGTGTTFTLLLPGSSEPVVQDCSSPAVAETRRSLRVLLVEDNADVAVVARDYLEQCGSTVIEAPSAEAAIERLNTDRGIEVVFSDIVMPGMNGLELARLVREHHPDIGIILASGYSDKASAALAEGFVLLSKPYSLDALRSELSRIDFAKADAA